MVFSCITCSDMLPLLVMVDVHELLFGAAKLLKMPNLCFCDIEHMSNVGLPVKLSVIGDLGVLLFNEIL